MSAVPTWRARPRLSLGLVALLLQLPTLIAWRPLILPDEAGFLLSAYQLGADGPPSGLFYYPGYSVLLAPVAAITTDLESVMLGVHLVNSLLAILTIQLAYSLAHRLLPRADPTTPMVVAVVAQLYPAFRLFSSFALSENLFVPTSLGLAVLAIDADRGSTQRRSAVLLAVTGGLAYAIHARAIALTLAAAVAIAFLVRRQPRRFAPAAAAWLAATAIGFAFVELVLSDGGVAIPGNDTGSTASSMLAKNQSLAAVGDWALGGVGQLFYLTIASGGLVALAGSMLVPSLRRRADHVESLAPFARFALPLFVASLGISVLFMAGAAGDPAIYGRYNEGVVAPVLVLGLAVAADRSTVGRVLAAAAVLVPLGAAVLVAARPADFYLARRQMINITAIHPITETVGSIRLGIVAAIAVGFLLLVRAGFGRSFVLGSVVLGTVWAATTGFDLVKAGAAIDVLDAQDELLEALDEAEAAGVAVDCVTLDLTGVGDRWHQSNYRLRRTDIEFRYWLSDSDTPPPCPDLVITRRADLSSVLPGSALLAIEPWSRMGLYAATDEARTVALHGRTTIDTPYATIGGDQVIEIELVAAPERLEVDETAEVTIRITNLGPRALVPHLGLEGAGGVNLGLEWRDPTRPTDRLVEPQRIALAGIVWPGDTVEAEATIVAADAPIAEGPWLLVAGVVQEGVAWLPDEVATEITVGG